MAIMQVNIPERRDFMSKLSQPLGLASTGAGLWGSMAGGGEAATTGGSQIWGAGIGYEGAGAGAANAGGAETGMAALGPAAAAGAAGAFQIKANSDYRQKGDKAGNAPYAMKDGNPAIHGNPMGDAMMRRMDGMKGGNPAEILMGGKDALGGLKLDDPTKALIGKKLDLGLAQLFKIKV